jgi:hypothetical protein
LKAAAKMVFENSTRIKAVNRDYRSSFQANGRQFSLSQRAGPLASEASANSYVVHSWVRENCSAQNLRPSIHQSIHPNPPNFSNSSTFNEFLDDLVGLINASSSLPSG